MLVSVLSITISLGFAACGPRVENSNIDALNRLYETAERSGKSLSIKEVESVLGQPKKMESFPIEMQTTRELPGVRYYYKQGDSTVELHFIDNKLIRRVLKFGEHLPEEKDMPGSRTMIPPAPIITPATPEPQTPEPQSTEPKTN